MIDEEKIEKAAEEYAANNYVDIFNGDRGYDSRDDVAETFKVAVKWRDENPPWMSVKESIPCIDPNIDILGLDTIFNKVYFGPVCYYDFENPRSEYYINSEGNTLSIDEEAFGPQAITHWMPLPSIKNLEKKEINYET